LSAVIVPIRIYLVNPILIISRPVSIYIQVVRTGGHTVERYRDRYAQIVVNIAVEHGVSSNVSPLTWSVVHRHGHV
jgi:hypothetical protein